MTPPQMKVLLVEDNPGDARLLLEMVREHGPLGMQLTNVATMADAEKYLTAVKADIIVLDVGLPDAEGLEAVRRAHAAAPHTPLVVLTGLDDEALAIKALQQGAQDYLIKGEIEVRGLLRSFRYAVERKIMDEALFVDKERAEVTLNSIGDAVICTDNDRKITFLNAVAETMTGWAAQEAAGQPMDSVCCVIDAARRVPVPGRLDIQPSRTEFPTSHCILIRRDGFEISVEDRVSPIYDRKGQVVGAVVVLRDVSVARAMALQMSHSAEHDFLTGLPNRMLLDDRISQAITFARRQARHVAVLFLDLDGFKHINDSLGHPIGDKLLKSIADRLVQCVRGPDTVSRQGGDEFVVLLSDLDQPAENAAVTARRMLSAVADVHAIDQHELHVTASIGVSVFPEDGADAETLIKNADTAMYQAKANGRQSYQFFKSEMNVRAVERQFIEEALRRALDQQEFDLHYQPKVDLETGAITGAEALIRWNHPLRGPISPAEFIPIAEDSGLILPIGAWVLRQACEETQRWVEGGLQGFSIAVNVSATEFRQEGYLDRLFTTLSETGLHPSALELELTEGVLMSRPEATASLLRAIRAHGIRVAVDDFGTGYSSLSYLRKFPLDVLKIDQSFIREVSAPGVDTAILTAVISMARSLSLRVVAEGVETQEELTFLRNHDCDEVQGYYLSRPIPARQFAGLLETGIREPAAALGRLLTPAMVSLDGERPG